MKKFTKFIALFLAILSLCAVAMPAMAATTMYVNCTPNVNFRTGPGTSYSLIDRIPYREAVAQHSTVTGTDGKKWSYVTYGGKNGYIMSQYLSATRPSEGSNPSNSHPQNATEAFGDYNNFNIGAQGTSVKNIQLALIHGGYLAAGNVTGYYGDLTKEAVTKFQSAHSSECGTADGIVGAKTKEALWKSYGGYLSEFGYK